MAEDIEDYKETLCVKRFASATDLTATVNRYQLQKSDIQTICRESDEYLLFYWA